MSSCRTPCGNTRAGPRHAGPAANYAAPVPRLSEAPAPPQRTGGEQARPAAPHDAEGELLLLLGHGLRGHLQALRGAIEVMQSVPSGSPTDVEARAIAARQAGQLSQHLEDLLDAGHVLTGQAALVLHPLELSGLAGRLIRDGHAGAACELQPGIAWVRADGLRLEQLAARLLQAAASQGAALRVQVHLDKDAGVLRIQSATGEPLPEAGHRLELLLAARLLRAQGGTLALDPSSWQVALPRAEPLPDRAPASPAVTPPPSLPQE